MKFHVGCGTVYLDGWLNVDLPGPSTFLARERPDLVDRWVTTDDKYYARHQDKTVDSLRTGPLDQEFVCDEYGSFISLPYSDAGLALQVEEILARHSFEHLSIREARFGLWKISRQIMPGGILRIDVPDHEETLRLLMDTKDPFYIRHLLGPRRNDYGYHMMSFTPDRLRKLVEEHGFEFIGDEPNIHIYPAFCLRFRKHLNGNRSIKY